MKKLTINGTIINENFIETASFNAETKTLSLHLMSSGTQTFTGPEAESAWKALSGAE